MPSAKGATTAEDVSVTATADKVEHTTTRRSGLGRALEGVIDQIESAKKEKGVTGERAQYLDQAKRSLLSAQRELNWFEGRNSDGSEDEDSERRKILESGPKGRDEVERQVMRDEIELQGVDPDEADKDGAKAEAFGAKADERHEKAEDERRERESKRAS